MRKARLPHCRHGHCERQDDWWDIGVLGGAPPLSHFPASGVGPGSHDAAVQADSGAFLVNSRSGGGRGRQLLLALRQRVGTDRVADLSETDLPTWTRQWSGRAEALIACGGDGTVAALLEAVHQTGASTPVGVIPLGTGNDLGRIAQMPLNANIDAAWVALSQAAPRAIDRWILRGPTGVRPWFNYCSWGVDARIAERFHRIRNQNGWWCRSRAANLLAYAGAGLQESGDAMALRAGGHGFPALPPWLRSLVILNIPSYAGGRHLGARVHCDDGYCDAFALGAGVALGLALSGCRQPHRLGRHRHIEVRLRRPAFLQLDGEPMLAAPGTYTMSHAGQVLLLAGAAPLPG